MDLCDTDFSMEMCCSYSMEQCNIYYKNGAMLYCFSKELCTEACLCMPNFDPFLSSYRSVCLSTDLKLSLSVYLYGPLYSP